jgi:hypothetical protein
MTMTENANPQFRKEGTVFMSTAGLPGRFASNFDFQLAGILGASPAGGAAVGECYTTISLPDRIQHGRPVRPASRSGRAHQPSTSGPSLARK